MIEQIVISGFLNALLYIKFKSFDKTILNHKTEVCSSVHRSSISIQKARISTEIMGRGRGKAKKSTTATNNEDLGSGEEEKLPTQKRRGRPTKPLKEDMDEHDDVAQDDHTENNNKSATKESSTPTKEDNGKKRKRNSQAKEKSSSVIAAAPAKEEETRVVVSNTTKSSSTSTVTTTSDDGSIKITNGFRHIGSRRKNKPRRAAEVGVECN